MPGRGFVLAFLCLILAATILVQTSKPFSKGHREKGSAPETARLHVVEAYGELPLRFETNLGQTDSQVRFLSRGPGYTLFLTSTEAVLTIPSRNPSRASNGATTKAAQTFQAPVHEKVPSKRATVLRMKLLGANPTPTVTGIEELPGKSNYFIGSDPTQWRTNVPNFAKVRYEKVYPGVDLIYYGNQRQLEYDFVVAPGTNPDIIELDIQGAERLELDAQGDLVLHTSGEQVRLRKPVVYQETGGQRQEIAGNYVLQSNHEIGFVLAAYDPANPW